MISTELLLLVWVFGVVSVVISVTGGLGNLTMRALRPESQASLMLFAIFCIRPLITRNDYLLFYGAQVDPAGRNQALVVGCTAFAGLTLGIMMARRRAKGPASSTAPPLGRGVPASNSIWLWGLLGIVGYVLLIVIIQGSSVANSLADGRSEEFDLLLPEVFTMLPLSGPAAVSLALIRRKTGTITPAFAASAFGLILLSVAALSLLGTRRFVIPALLMPLVPLVYQRGVRLRPRHLVTLVPVALFLLLLPLTRSAGGRRPGESLIAATVRVFREQGITETVLTFFTSYDTEMFDYIALVAPTLGGANPYGAGRGTFLEFLSRPLPAGLQSAHSDTLISRNFGGVGCDQAACPVASLPGVLYFDFGLIGVLIGCVAAGYAFARITRVLCNNHSSERALILAVVITANTIILVRTNTSIALWWSIYLCLIAFTISHFARRATVATMSPSRKDSRGD